MNHRDVTLNVEMTQVLAMLQKLLKLIEKTLQPVYFVYDGVFGNNAAVQMSRRAGLHLITKLRNNSGLYFSWNGIYSGKGKAPIYGDRIDYSNLYVAHLKLKETKKQIYTCSYQINVVCKKFSDSSAGADSYRKNGCLVAKVLWLVLFFCWKTLRWHAYP